MTVSRRALIKGIGSLGLVSATGLRAQSATSTATTKPIQWISTSQSKPWQSLDGAAFGTPSPILFNHDVIIDTAQKRQPIEGFGGAFTELGWDGLMKTSAENRNAIMEDLFGAEGCAFNICRTPIAANDLSRKWYSYNETPNDFAMKNFSAANDETSLIPYINAAQKVQPKLKLWASPWSPPTWMKKNKHYAMVPAWAGTPENGLKPDQVGIEGQDYFITEPRYFKAYALYFRKYVEAYAKAGIPISMVMPQNEFSSTQPFPSCSWNPKTLATFISYLGPEMEKMGVDVFFGTLERGNAQFLIDAMANPQAAKYIKGVGVQWAGRGALPGIKARFPNLPIWGSEQECGIGTNDWHYARYIFRQMRSYFEAGARTWMYWDMVMPQDNHSTWGWPQNSMITVNNDGSVVRHHEYYLLKHFSHFIKPGAHYLNAASYFGYDNVLAFANPDGSVVLVAQNDMGEPMTLHIDIGAKQLKVTLPADSFNTLVV